MTGVVAALLGARFGCSLEMSLQTLLISACILWVCMLVIKVIQGSIHVLLINEAEMRMKASIV